MKEPIIFTSLFISILLSILLIIKISILKKTHSFSSLQLFKKIDKVLIVFSLLTILISFLFHINYLQYRTPIPYSEWETITLNDFLGIKIPSESLYDNSEFAYIFSSINIEESSTSVIVETRFHPSRSYVFNNNMPHKFLLNHELNHLHITEFFARKIRQQIFTHNKTSRTYSVNEILKKNLLFEDEMQYLYDSETYHGILLGKQKYWEHKVDSLLSTLDRFSNPCIQIQLK